MYMNTGTSAAVFDSVFVVINISYNFYSGIQNIAKTIPRHFLSSRLSTPNTTANAVPGFHLSYHISQNYHTLFPVFASASLHKAALRRPLIVQNGRQANFEAQLPVACFTSNKLLSQEIYVYNVSAFVKWIFVRTSERFPTSFCHDFSLPRHLTTPRSLYSREEKSNFLTTPVALFAFTQLFLFLFPSAPRAATAAVLYVFSLFLRSPLTIHVSLYIAKIWISFSFRKTRLLVV